VPLGSFLRLAEPYSHGVDYWESEPDDDFHHSLGYKKRRDSKHLVGESCLADCSNNSVVVAAAVIDSTLQGEAHDSHCKHEVEDMGTIGCAAVPAMDGDDDTCTARTIGIHHAGINRDGY